MEQLLIRKIKGGLMGLKTGTKTKEEVWKHIKKLKEINNGLGGDYENEYISVVKALNDKK